MCECGFHESLTSDKSNHFTFDVKTCPVCSGADRFGRIQAAEDKAFRDRLGDNPNPAAPDPADGRRVFARALSQLEVEQRRDAKRPPLSR